MTRPFPVPAGGAAEGNAALDETIAAYDSLSDEYARRFANADLREHRVLFQNSLVATLPVLDAGCGSGRDCSLFERSGLTPVGIDLSSRLLHLARRVTRAPLVLGDVRNLPFRDASFGGVWCCAVLLHLELRDSVLAVNEFYRVMIGGGTLFLALRYGHGSEWRRDPIGPRRWFRFYTQDELVELLREAGFTPTLAIIEEGVASPGPWINIHARKN